MRQEIIDSTLALKQFVFLRCFSHTNLKIAAAAAQHDLSPNLLPLAAKSAPRGGLIWRLKPRRRRAQVPPALTPHLNQEKWLIQN
jgi:hypothetical protein